MQWFIILYIALVLSAYIVPYTVLSGAERLSGSFLYWTIFGLVCITLLFIMMGKWKNE